MSARDSKKLRSYRWFGPDDLRSFGHRSKAKQMGLGAEDYEGKPVIGILNTWSELNNCHTHFRERAQDVKRGVWQAGGLPLEVPIMTLSETFMKPTTMYYRNLVAMEVEETLRCYPIDGAVLMGGCDKTTPALIMGATSAAIPSVFLPAGPMVKGCWKGETLGSGSDAWKYWAERTAGRLGCDAWMELEDGIARSPGTCMTMGTASTMACVVEALGLALPGSSSIPAPYSAHNRMAAELGRRIVDLAWDQVSPKTFLSKEAFENAITIDMAIGGSTNAIVHIIAMAQRAGVDISLDDFDRLSKKVPTLVNLRPMGKHLMPDFHDAGGLPGLMSRIRDLLDLDRPTISGQSIGENIQGAGVYDDDVIRPRENPVFENGSTFVLRGNLAPNGCVIKPGAADPKMLNHRGQAVVFKDYNDLKARLDDPDLDITEDHVIVLQDAGPVGGPGMPEWGMLPIPKKLLQKGVRDMVRISDARMSGTSYGACVLHVAPESRVGGPLAFVQDGDWIELNVHERRIHLDIDDAEFERRKVAWVVPEPRFTRGYGKLYAAEVNQANQGCDFNFLKNDGSEPAEPEIH